MAALGLRSPEPPQRHDSSHLRLTSGPKNPAAAQVVSKTRVCDRSSTLGYRPAGQKGGFEFPILTPPAIVDKMNEAIVKVLNQPNVRTHFAEADKEVVGYSAAEFKKFIAADAERLRAQVQISGAKAE